MNIRWKICVVGMLIAGSCNVATRGVAADPPDLFLEHLLPFVWTGNGGNATWENAANWTAPVFPAGYPYPIPTYPNDPGRVDDSSVQANITTIWPVVGADLSGALTADRTVNIASGNVTVASLKMGGTGAAVTTDLTSTSPNRLVFENTELNDTVTNPGNPNANPVVQPEPIYGFNQGRSLIWSTGTAAAGKVNRISADMQLNDGVDVEGDRDLHIYGTIYEGVTDRDGINTGYAENLESSINSLLSGGKKLYIHGNIVSVGLTSNGEPSSSDGPGGDRRFGINVERGNLVPPDPQNPPAELTRQGDVDISGSFLGNGVISIGADGGNVLPLSNVFLRGDSSAFTGRVLVNRVNLVIDNDNAFGSNKVKTGNPVQSFGFNYISTSDTRKIATPVDVAQWQTVRGATGIAGLEGVGDHSIEFSGAIAQSNTRGWINLLPAGKTLTFSGPVYANIKAENPPGLGRAMTFDGTGTTKLTGGYHDQLTDASDPPTVENKIGYLRVRGTTNVIIDGRVFDGSNNVIGFNDTDNSGHTFVQGGNLNFRGGLNDAFAGDDLPNGQIISRAGAVGVDEGTRTNATFLAKLNNSSNPIWNPATAPYFDRWGDNAGLFDNYSTGGLMLGTVGTNEYAQNLDFTSGDLERAANMSLAAQPGGSTYTGTITPSSTVAVNPNTYQLGGGAGTLTLPNANQLTGSRNLLATNGGEVRITGSNNYTGVTRILGKYLPTNTTQAQNSQRASVGNNDETGTAQLGTTLTASTLANGGAASSIGSSTNAASNLVIQGSTLKYDGGAASTDRLFTVGTAGATIDASGSGAVNFSNTGALAISVPAQRSALLATGVPGGNNRTIFGQPSFTGTPATRKEFQTEDLALGMRVYTTNGDFTQETGGSPIRITSITNREVMQVGQPSMLPSEADTNASTTPNAWPGYTTGGAVRVIRFGPAPARFLTLSGANTGNNTLAPVVGDAAVDPNAAPTTPEIAAAELAAGYGTVGINKTGSGKWILTGANSYSGATNVQAGTLLVNGNQTGASLTTVSSGAAFGGTGQIGGNLVMSEGSSFVAAFAGGAIDPLNVLGNVDLSALGNILNVTGTAAGTHTLLTYVGTLTGTFESTPGWNVNYGSGTNSAITITASAAAALIGDYNNNGVVDAADYTVWRNNLGGAGSTLGANRDPSNGSGVVSTADYNSWKAHFGATAGSGSGSLAAGAVPEPASCVLVGMVLAAAACVRRRQG